MQRIGVLGGTFNPIHIGHLAVAQTALDKMNLQKVIFVPTNIPPHKSAHSVAPARDRYNMIRIAIGKNRLFDVSDFEIKKEGKSYSIDTMRYFKSIFPNNTELFFIVVGDLLNQLEKWKYIKDLVKIVRFVVVNRPGQLRKKTWVKYFSVSMPGIDISSSYVRQRIAQNKTIRYFVPDRVVSYINKHKLYQARQFLSQD